MDQDRPAPVVGTPTTSTNASASARTNVGSPGATSRPNRIGLFGMVSEECLERIRCHVAPIKGLHPWTAQAIYTALAVCASKQGSATVADGQRCWVSVAELASRTGMGRRNVERYLPVLRDAGVIKIVHAHDALHRPTASHYLFVYPHMEERNTPTPESVSPAAEVAHNGVSATRESAALDSRVGALVESQESISESGPEHANDVERQGGTRENDPASITVQPVTMVIPPVPSHTPVDTDGADDRWSLAQHRLAAQVTPASYNAWLRPLVLLTPSDATESDAGVKRVVLGCLNAFQRDQVERRYRKAIEVAVGAHVELVVLDSYGDHLRGAE